MIEGTNHGWVVFGKVCILKYLLNSKDVGDTIHSLLKTSQLNEGDYLFCSLVYSMYD